jgi:beta-1,2-mannobiose phosphorylase / 1,2-beta-oligomannan phosphorylase
LRVRRLPLIAVMVTLLLAGAAGLAAAAPRATADPGADGARGAGAPMAAMPGWESQRVVDPRLVLDGSVFKMWYSGQGQDNAFRIGYATSSDGAHWTKYAENPVLDAGPEGSWDQRYARVGTVLKDGATYRMWYWAFNGGIGYATSADGVHWTEDPGNPVLSRGASGEWDEGAATQPAVVLDGGLFKMWYTGLGADGVSGHAWIGYATSPDGVTWTKHPGNPVLDPGASGWDAGWTFNPVVIAAGGTYKMWYSGADSLPMWESILRIGYATSPDGISWTRWGANPILDVTAGAWDSVSVTAPWVVQVGGTYHLWYHGANCGTCGGEQIGHAVSSNGTSWTKDADNPVLRLGSTCTVTSTADGGPGTLRQCLENQAPYDTITFDPVVFPPGSPATIAVTSALAELSAGNLTIDASDAGVILDGSGIGDEGVDGLYVSSSGNVIRGLQILNFPGRGIYLVAGPMATRLGEAPKSATVPQDKATRLPKTATPASRSTADATTSSGGTGSARTRPAGRR